MTEEGRNLAAGNRQRNYRNGYARGNRLTAALHVTLDRAEDGVPDRMPGLGGGEVELRVDLEHLAELVPAEPFAPARAVDERQVLAGKDAVFVVGQPQFEGGLQVAQGVLVVALAVLLDAGTERRMAAVLGKRGLRARDKRGGKDEGRQAEDS